VILYQIQQNKERPSKCLSKWFQAKLVFLKINHSSRIRGKTETIQLKWVMWLPLPLHYESRQEIVVTLVRACDPHTDADHKSWSWRQKPLPTVSGQRKPQPLPLSPAAPFGRGSNCLSSGLILLFLFEIFGLCCLSDSFLPLFFSYKGMDLWKKAHSK